MYTFGFPASSSQSCCVRACVRAGVRACRGACVRACVRACVCVCERVCVVVVVRACVFSFSLSPVMLGVSIQPRILLVQVKLVYLWFKCVMFGANGNLSDIAEYSIS